MRVITGLARGARLLSPEGHDVRPTGEKTKEALFSILHNELEGARVLDLFAGSGQLGIEALSRGARSCTFIDSSRRSLEIVRENLRRTGLEDLAQVRQGDGLSLLAGAREEYDIALLDPPYREGLLARALPLAAAAMRPGGVIVCETDSGEELPERAGALIRGREYRYGKTKLTLYRAAQGEASPC